MHEKHMCHALALGRRGLGKTWPNPAVGCVVVKDGHIVGRGWTQPSGRPHAEVVALNQAGSKACGADVYVTLEPCAHVGHTPPCASTLIKAKVARVFVALGDPDLRVNGQGLAMLREAGIEVFTDLCAQEARFDHQGFLLRVTQNRPMLTLKMASSWDGRIATKTGESQWITGPQARRFVHAMRSNHDAVLVGAGTVRADDPLLNVRDLGVDHQPVRVVLSKDLDIPSKGRLAQSAKQSPLWVVCAENIDESKKRLWQDIGAQVVSVPLKGHRIDLHAALRALSGQGLTRIFCEGGGELAASLLKERLVDRLVQFSAGMALGAEARPSLGAMEVDALSCAPRFDLLHSMPVGKDLLSTWVARS